LDCDAVNDVLKLAWVW